ncbi:MAG: uracil-DNA glycosylase [Bythopirellula sp.]|nr:uracil-DNA glycosylase [Bythopirellula sp.]
MPEPPNSQLARQALQLLESLQGAGVQQLPKPGPLRRAVEKPSAKPEIVAPEPAPAASVVSPAMAKQPASQDATLFELPDAVPTEEVSTAVTLEILRDEVAACTKCHELATTRTQTVFGVGNPQARLCFLGEAPGADEDRLGEPFVGKGGQLLNKIMEACRLKREDVYILNVIKCRPPGNRNPTPQEAQNCRPYLLRQLELIQPEFICCLGAVAAQNLLQTTDAIGKLRGKVHKYQGINVVCTYHPAYLLRNPAAKKFTWDDMKLLMREMGTPVD